MTHAWQQKSCSALLPIQTSIQNNRTRKQLEEVDSRIRQYTAFVECLQLLARLSKTMIETSFYWGEGSGLQTYKSTLKKLLCSSMLGSHLVSAQNTLPIVVSKSMRAYEITTSWVAAPCIQTWLLKEVPHLPSWVLPSIPLDNESSRRNQVNQEKLHTLDFPSGQRSMAHWVYSNSYSLVALLNTSCSFALSTWLAKKLCW